MEKLKLSNSLDRNLNIAQTSYIGDGDHVSMNQYLVRSGGYVFHAFILVPVVLTRAGCAPLQFKVAQVQGVRRSGLPRDAAGRWRLAGAHAFASARGEHRLIHLSPRLQCTNAKNGYHIATYSMKPAGEARWEGTILDPRNGKIYQSNMTLRSVGLLRVEGCVMGMLCGGETWTRSK